MTTEDKTIVSRLESLGAHLQNLGERFSAISKLEKSPVWAFFFAGMAFASKWDASRIRECFGANVIVTNLPDIHALVMAYEAMAVMVASAAQPTNAPGPPRPIPVPDWADRELYKDQRAAQEELPPDAKQPDPSPAQD